MKQSMFFTSLLALLLLVLPQTIFAVTSKPNPDIQISRRQENVKGKGHQRASFKEKISRKVERVKQKLRKWKASIIAYLPTGKLMTSLVFLLLSIIFFAIGGLTTLGVLFNLLGSTAVIVALVFFVLWLTERAKAPTN